MNPYNRFSLFSSSVTAALMLGALIASGPALIRSLSGLQGSALSLGVVAVASVTVLVVFWMAFTEVILPSLFRLDTVRKAILGRYYIEGTWLQAEKGNETSRIAVIDIQPNGKSFTFSGYALDENLDVNSNVLLELSRFEWPFLTFKYRNSLSDGADGQRDGVGEVQFEMNRSSARRYNGYSQYIKNEARVRLEGSKIVRNADVKRLRTLEGREEIIDTYWDLFFGRNKRRLEKARSNRPVAAAASAKQQAAAQTLASRIDDTRNPGYDDAFEMKASAAKSRQDEPLELSVRAMDERRKGEAERPEGLEERIIPRRRSSDWSGPLDDADDFAEPLGSLEEASADVDTPSKTEDDASDKARKAALDARHVM